MERRKRRLVTQTNPFITKLTENGIKKNKGERTVFCAVLKIISTSFRVNLSWTRWIAIVQRTFSVYKKKFSLSDKTEIRDRSFFMSMGGLVGFRGGPREKKWH